MQRTVGLTKRFAAFHPAYRTQSMCLAERGRPRHRGLT